MKTYILSLIALFIVSPSFSQTSDDQLKIDVVGTWQHVSSTDYHGNIIRYERKLELFSDGTGICTRNENGVDIKLPFYWEIVNGSINLFVENKRGKRINTDSQLIWDLDEFSMNLACTWESDEYLGTSSFYKRMKEEEAKF